MLRFLSRLAFLCNLLLIPVILIHHVPSFARWDAGLVSYMVITTYFIGLPVNLLVNVWISGLLVQKKKTNVPRWLQIVNALFLLLQFYYFQFT